MWKVTFMVIIAYLWGAIMAVNHENLPIVIASWIVMFILGFISGFLKEEQHA